MTTAHNSAPGFPLIPDPSSLIPSGRARFALSYARIEAAATGNRNSIFDEFFSFHVHAPECEIAAPAAAFRTSQFEKMREKPRKSRFFGLCNCATTSIQ
jgi:hypothetical protein